MKALIHSSYTTSALVALAFGFASIAKADHHVDDEGYCIPPFTQDTYVGLTKVALNSDPEISRESEQKEFYIHTGAQGTVRTGDMYKLSGTSASDNLGQGFQTNVVVWVDWNNDKDFDDADEEVARWMRKVGTLLPVQFSVPATAKIGTTRMRVYCDMTEEMDHPLPTPCGYEEFGQFKLGHHGEVEDYVLNVTAGTNSRPTLDIEPTLKATVGRTFDAFVSATDPDGDEVYYTVLEKPEWLKWSDTTIAEKRGIRLYGMAAAPGTSTVKVLIIDGRGSEVRETLTIEAVTVTKPTESKLLYPTHVNTFEEGEEVVFRWNSASLPGATVKYSLLYKVDTEPAQTIRDLSDTTYTWVAPVVKGGKPEVMVNWLVTAYDAADEGNSAESKGESFMIKASNLSVYSNDLATQVMISPNPASNWINIQSASSFSQVEIYNTTGSRVKHLLNDPLSSSMKLDVHGLANGAYTMVLLGGTGERTSISIQIQR